MAGDDAAFWAQKTPTVRVQEPAEPAVGEPVIADPRAVAQAAWGNGGGGAWWGESDRKSPSPTRKTRTRSSQKRWVASRSTATKGKVESQRADAAARELEECTFSPNLMQSRTASCDYVREISGGDTMKHCDRHMW